MECRIQSMAESNSHAESSVPTGKVEAVCREWLIREDGVLAYKLQSEEIQHHYGHNKEKNQLVRTDIQEAKMVQRSEQEEAELMQQAYERMLLEQEEADALVAKQIQERLLQEELERQRQIEEEDKRIALELQKKEKLRLQKKREERELRQVEKVKAVQSNSNEGCSSHSSNGGQPTCEASTSPLDQDFTDLCLQPPEDLSEEEQRRFREDQDAELAKFLQQQELKRRNPRVDDQVLAIEAQDRELARALQEQERAKARRARERAKQKAMQQQQKQDPAVCITAEEPEIHYAISPIEDPEASPEHLVMKDNECYGIIGDCKSVPSPPVNNIAMVLDPTYNHRRGLADGRTSSRSSVTNSPSSSAQHSPNETLLHGQRGLSPDFFVQADDEDAVAPPYMPIQGQRRPQTLEKTKRSKKYREGCKTQ